MRITVHNRGPEAAELHVLPQLWFRNTWSWKRERAEAAADARRRRRRRSAQHPTLGDVPPATSTASAELLFCDNETNVAAAVRRRTAPGLLQGRVPRVRRRRRSRRPSIRSARGTKAAAHYRLDDARPAASRAFALRLAAERARQPVRRLRRRSFAQRAARGRRVLRRAADGHRRRRRAHRAAPGASPA